MLALVGFLVLGQASAHAQIIDDVKNSAKQTATSKAEDQTNATTTSTFNKVDSAASKSLKKITGIFKKKQPAPNNTAAANGSAPGATATAAQGAQNTGGATPNATTPSGNDVTITAYSNYDFVPGAQVLFEDAFTEDQDGEFPSHWKLNSGQGVVNKIGADQCFFLTEGNYVKVAPRLTSEKDYLPDSFTVEFDFYALNGAYRPMMLFTTTTDENRFIQVGEDVSTGYFPKDFSGTYPGDKENTYNGRWHHAAMIKKGNQLKFYEDQYRVLVIPDCGECKMSFLEMGGIGNQDHPLVFRNFRLAKGGNMNLIGQKFTDTKIVTHGINFDVDKATIRPESMGTLNMIVNVLQTNPDVKFEIDGHTDNTGDANHNLQLSQARADAVRTQLVSMGIDGSRLTTKGFGSTVPVADNSTLEGRANNRRVEFVKTT